MLLGKISGVSLILRKNEANIKLKVNNLIRGAFKDVQNNLILRKVLSNDGRKKSADILEPKVRTPTWKA